jgi:polyhydroxyalkanoate synthesis regulator phasin
MTEDLIKSLMLAGLTKQQATSTTANTLVRLFMPENGKMLIQEARQQVDEIKALVDKLKGEYNELKGRLDNLSSTLHAVSEAQEQHGSVTDEKARNIIALYGALLAMSQKAGADAEDAVRNASYILYAYLGGQARRDITYVTDQG